MRLAERGSGIPRLVPGFIWVAIVTAASFFLHSILDLVSILMLALILAALFANLGMLPAAAEAGVSVAGRYLLRIGIVLLGFRIALTNLLDLGAEALTVVVVVVIVTFLATRWAGHALGLEAGLSLLIATGFSICGNSAIAAMRGISDASDEEVAYSMTLVTLYGSLAIVVLPLLQVPLGLDAEAFGAWAGASVHDVAQVIATASNEGAASIQAAVVVKLVRIMLLVPLVSWVALSQGRRLGNRPRSSRVPLVPPFVIGFLGAIFIRSLGILPPPWIVALAGAETVALAAAIAAVGAGARVAAFRKLGMRGVILGFLSWTIIAVVAYAGMRVIDI